VVDEGHPVDTFLSTDTTCLTTSFLAMFISLKRADAVGTAALRSCAKSVERRFLQCVEFLAEVIKFRHGIDVPGGSINKPMFALF
jgi:hypothetical protein